MSRRVAALALCLFAVVSATPRAHEIPNEVTVRTFLKPEGNKLIFLVRAPLKAMREMDVPRRAGGYVAFNEGWALYSELLCKEMGAYPDAAADFMRLDAELFRAARLVVDTGIHADGWTEDKAVDYLMKTARMSPDHARSEVQRYITLPGQATGYKIGMLKIMELRRKAEAALGSKFDVKAFDDLIISEGSQPLPVLERRVKEWIAARKA